jgi:hypothetical protein
MSLTTLLPFSLYFFSSSVFKGLIKPKENLTFGVTL